MSSSNKEHHLALSLIGTIFGIIWKPLQNGSSKVILTLVLCYFQKGSSQPEEKLLKTKVRLLRIMMSNIQVTKRFEIYKPLKLFLTLELSQYRRCVSTVSSSEPVAARPQQLPLTRKCFVICSLSPGRLADRRGQGVIEGSQPPVSSRFRQPDRTPFLRLAPAYDLI